MPNIERLVPRFSKEERQEILYQNIDLHCSQLLEALEDTSELINKIMDNYFTDIR